MWHTCVEDEHPDSFEMLTIHLFLVSVESHRKVYARRAHLTTNWVSSNGPTNSMVEYGMRFCFPVGCVGWV